MRDAVTPGGSAPASLREGSPLPLRGRRQALLLAGVTGFCGLGSESVYLKLLDFNIGSSPLVAFTVVAAFILGMGIGSQLSARVRWPWVVEAGLGLYSLGMVLLHVPILRSNAYLLGILVPALGPNLAPAALGVLYLALPTLLLGVTFPALVETSRDPGWAYLSQGLGAFLGIASVEALIYPRFGLHGALYVMAALHILAAGLLFGRPIYRYPVVRAGAVSVSLVVVGIGTGAFQGIWLLLATLLFHPFYFMQPIVVGTMILGICIGAWLWKQSPRSYEWILVAVLAGVCVSTILVGVWVLLPPPGSLVAVIVQTPMLLLPAAIPIGAVYPAFLRGREANRREAGAALLSLSIGNAIGVLASGALLLPFLPPVLCIAAAAAAIAAVSGYLRRSIRIEVPLLFAMASVAWLADEARFIKHVQRDHHRVEVERVFRGPGELSAIYQVDRRPSWTTQRFHERRLYLSGWSPLVLEERASLLQEASSGAIAAAASPRFERALVLGAGSGRAAGYVARVFQHTDVVDIADTVPAILRALRTMNYDLLEAPGMEYHQMDAILAPFVFEPASYDLIFSTVNPVYVDRAAKLYTLEYIESLKGLLRPGGVFVTWSDTSIPREANQILVNTAGRPFRFQRLWSVDEELGFNYYMLIQSDSPLEFRPRRLRTSALGEDLATTVLIRSRTRLVLPTRFHDSRVVHSFFHPAASILFSGYPHFGNED